LDQRYRYRQETGSKVQYTDKRLNQRFTTQARVWIKGTINIQEIESEAHNTYKRLGKRYSIQKRDWIRDWFRDIAQR